MKEVEVEIIVPDCTAQAWFDAIYAGDAALRAFHAKVNKDPAAAVEAWGPDGRRITRFTMPMAVPAMLKKIIGMDAVPVVETQCVEWVSPRACFKLASVPQLGFPGANKFTTAGHLVVSSRPDGSCSIKAFIQCAAAMPWPMAATVEGLMATEATNSISKFLDWCQAYYASWRAEQHAVPEPPAAAAAAPSATARFPRAATVEGGETFFDACEDEASAAAAVEGEEAAEAVVPYQPPRLEDVIVDCLRQIQASTAETASSLKALEEMIRNMDENMQVMRDKLVGRRPSPPAATAATAAAGSTATCHRRAGPASAASTSTSAAAATGGGYLRVLAGLALLCGAGAAAYMRYGSRGAGSGGGGGGGG